jgi:aspartokinase
VTTVPEALEGIVTHMPFLEEGLRAGLLNLSAVARQLRPDLETRLGHGITDVAIAMGLRRLALRLRKKTRPLGNVLPNIRDLALRSDLVAFTFQTSGTILDRKRQLLSVMAERRDTFVAITQGISEVTLIVSRSAASDVTRLFARERAVARVDELSSITVRLPERAVGIPGVHYSILKQLAWHDINVVEVVSTYTELSIVLANADVDRAFAVLKRFLWG